MNTAIRVLTQENFVLSKTETKSSALPKRSVLLLLLAVLASAITLIYVKDLNRCLFIDYQDSLQVAQKLEVEHNKLLLEESAWANSSRIQKIAEERWNMKSPLSNKMILIKVL
jgi:cell division protein FtsL